MQIHITINGQNMQFHSQIFICIPIPLIWSLVINNVGIIRKNSQLQRFSHRKRERSGVVTIWTKARPLPSLKSSPFVHLNKVFIGQRMVNVYAFYNLQGD